MPTGMEDLQVGGNQSQATGWTDCSKQRKIKPEITFFLRLLSLFVCLFAFLGPHLRHMEVPGLEVE